MQLAAVGVIQRHAVQGAERVKIHHARAGVGAHGFNKTRRGGAACGARPVLRQPHGARRVGGDAPAIHGRQHVALASQINQ